MKLSDSSQTILPLLPEKQLRERCLKENRPTIGNYFDFDLDKLKKEG